MQSCPSISPSCPSSCVLGNKIVTYQLKSWCPVCCSTFRDECWDWQTVLNLATETVCDFHFCWEATSLITFTEHLLLFWTRDRLSNDIRLFLSRPDTSWREQRRLPPPPGHWLPSCPWNAQAKIYNFFSRRVPYTKEKMPCRPDTSGGNVGDCLHAPRSLPSCPGNSQ